MITYSTDDLKSLNRPKLRLDPLTWKSCRNLGLVEGTKRGIRSGRRFKILNPPSHLPFESKKERKQSPKYDISFGYVNARSCKNKTLELNDFVLENDFDIFFISETWLSDIGCEVEISELTPPGYSFIHCTRSNGNYGGVGLLYRSSFNVINIKKIVDYQSFEYIIVQLSLSKDTITLACIYRPPPSEKNKLTVKLFHEEFSNFLDSFLTKDKFIILGDINIHYNKKLDTNTIKFIDLFDTKNLKQWIDVPTHVHGNTLDWLITHENAHSFINKVDVKDYLISDHFVISIKTDFSKPKFEKTKIRCRNIKSIDKIKFKNDLLNSKLIQNTPEDLEDLVTTYNA